MVAPGSERGDVAVTVSLAAYVAVVLGGHILSHSSYCRCFCQDYLKEGSRVVLREHERKGYHDSCWSPRASQATL